MGFKRATWHSGLTYKQTCEECGTEVIYQDDKLDFRPWYADGFVYCPKCNRPLRHNENYAIDAALGESIDLTPKTAKSAAGYCTQCGKAFREGDKFCSGCGTERK